MGQNSPELTVQYTATAREHLSEILLWNVERHDPSHAIEYLLFLEDRIGELSQCYPEGRPVEGFEGLFQYLIRKGRGGFAHVVIFKLDRRRQTINVVHVYHERQDNVGRLREEGFGQL